MSDTEWAASIVSSVDRITGICGLDQLLRCDACGGLSCADRDHTEGET